MADLTKIRNLRENQLNEIAVGEIVLNVDAMTYVTKNSEGNVVPYLIPISRPYKVYTALLTQTGTDAPVATVLENTLGGTVVWTRSAAGSYLGTLANAFTANKTFLFPPTAYSSADFNDWQLLLVRNNANAVLVTTSTAGGTTGADDILSEVPIEIRVYN